MKFAPGDSMSETERPSVFSTLIIPIAYGELHESN